MLLFEARPKISCHVSALKQRKKVGTGKKIKRASPIIVVRKNSILSASILFSSLMKRVDSS